MSARVVGAILAFAAATALTLSSFSGAWWNGHPTVNGTSITRKDVQIGLGGGRGCNNGGETHECTELALTGGVPALLMVEFVTSNLAALVILAVGVTILQREPRRKILGKAAIAATAAAIFVGLLLLVLGPGVKAEHVSVPIGYGMLVFWLGAASSIASGLVAQRELPPPSTKKLRLPPARALPPPPTAPVQQPFDVLALLREEPPREPVAVVERPPPSPGGNLPGYPGPLGAPSVDGAPSPLFAAAPQLRPLYEMNGGVAPTTSPPPVFPNRPPTPIPRASISAAAGIPTPPPFSALNPPRVPMPARTKPAPSQPPPISRAQPSASPINRAQATISSMAVPPPTNPAPPSLPAPPVVPAQPPPRVETDASDRAETQAREDETHKRELETVERSGEFSESNDVGDRTSPSVAPAGSEESAADEPSTERESSDDIETIAIDKIRPSDLGIATADTAPAEATTSDPARPDTSTGTTEIKVAISTAPESLPPPDDRAAGSGPSPACPQCEAPMRWVEEHLRFYCKSCRMYF